MNCLEAQALVSAAHDGETVSESELAAAQAHCEDCEECTAFLAGLTWLDVMPVPAAPDGLVERVLAAVEPLQVQRAEALAIRAEEDEAESVGLELPVPEDEPAPDEWALAAEPFPSPSPRSRFEWFQGPTRWASLGAVGALAATALIAFVISGLGGPGASDSRTASTADRSVAAPEAARSGTGQKAAPAYTGTLGADAGTPAQAPDYVLYKEYVYKPGALLADSAAATPTIGSLTTAFASGGAQTATVYRSPVTDGSIVVKGPDGLRVYSPVTRMLASVRFQLTSGKPIERFGVWPVLPTRFPVPTTTDGSPSFVAAGTDSEGVPIYAATGRPVTEGFAVAPGTSTSDPAGGNPNWTWWAPAPTNP